MKYSFVIPAYKSTFLKEAIDSILAQTVDDMELIVVNDCSPHDIETVIAPYRSCNLLRYYVNAENMGGNNLAGSWNKALMYATGEYVIMASDDDIYAPNFLEQADRLIAAHPDCDMVRGRVAIINEQGEMADIECRFDEYQTTADFCFYLHRYGIKCASNYIYRRETFIEKGGFVCFPLAWYSDIATPQVMAKRGVLNTQDVAFYFRRSQIQLTRNNTLVVLEKKLIALQLCWSWQQDFFKALPPHIYLTAQALFRARIHIVNTTTDHMRNISLWHIKLWWHHVFKNPVLYNYEKAEIVAARIVNIMR